jgi:RNA polymerase sigma factor for flagellar operon FliA
VKRTKAPGLLDDDQLEQAWLSFKLAENKRSRELLILHYQPLVHSVAKRVGVTLPAHIDDEDLVSYGTFGLLDAMEKYDLDRHATPCSACGADREDHCKVTCVKGCKARRIKFATYASTRIRGAIIDELRTIDWIPRSVRSQVRDINQAVQQLERELQRTPNDQEIADHIGISLTDLHKNKGQQNFIHMVALDALIDQSHEAAEGSASIMSQLEDNRTQSPVLAYETEEIKYNLAQAVSTLPEREAIVLCLYYYEGLTLAEIGQVLNVTESRVCQMHTRAMGAVRGRLADVA